MGGIPLPTTAVSLPSHRLENNKIAWDSADRKLPEKTAIISKADVVRRDPDSAPEHLRVARLRAKLPSHVCLATSERSSGSLT